MQKWREKGRDRDKDIEKGRDRDRESERDRDRDCELTSGMLKHHIGRVGRKLNSNEKS